MNSYYTRNKEQIIQSKFQYCLESTEKNLFLIVIDFCDHLLFYPWTKTGIENIAIMICKKTFMLKNLNKVNRKQVNNSYFILIFFWQRKQSKTLNPVQRVFF